MKLFKPGGLLVLPFLIPEPDTPDGMFQKSMRFISHNHPEKSPQRTFRNGRTSQNKAGKLILSVPVSAGQLANGGFLLV